MEGWEGLRLLGPHLRQIGRPKGGVGSSVCPSYLPKGSKHSPKIKKYFGELKSARGRDQFDGVGVGSSKGALVFDKGGPLAPALILF